MDPYKPTLEESVNELRMSWILFNVTLLQALEPALFAIVRLARWVRG